MGDWGGLPDFPYRTPIQKAVGDEMGKIADSLDIQFVLALGDNFYFYGIKDVDDPRFKVIYMYLYGTCTYLFHFLEIPPEFYPLDMHVMYFLFHIL